MVIVFDFDGTIVNSYSYIPDVYKKIKIEFGLPDGFIELMLIVEDMKDYLSLFDRRIFLREHFREYDCEEILNFYWKERMKSQKVFEDLYSFVKKCEDREFYLVSAKDDTVDIKAKRIKYSNIDKYFKDITIYGGRSKKYRRSYKIYFRYRQGFDIY